MYAQRITCLKVWLRLLFKMFFVSKCIKIIYFFYFLKSAHQNDSKHTKKLIFSKNKIEFVRNAIFMKKKLSCQYEKNFRKNHFF